MAQLSFEETIEAIIFLLAALLHLGIQFPLGFSEPRIIP